MSQENFKNYPDTTLTEKERVLLKMFAAKHPELQKDREGETSLKNVEIDSNTVIPNDHEIANKYNDKGCFAMMGIILSGMGFGASAAIEGTRILKGEKPSIASKMVMLSALAGITSFLKLKYYLKKEDEYKDRSNKRGNYYH